MEHLSQKKGFTLIELLIVVAIMGILAAVAAPNFREYMVNKRLNGAASQVMSDLMNARMLSVKLNRNVRVVFPASPSAAYTYDSAGSQQATRNIQTDFEYYDVTVSANNNPTFTPIGRLSGITACTITLTSSASGNTKLVRVSSAGRVVIN